MKKTAIILLTLLIAIAVNSCKKDYPKDIPDWLKDKIRYCDKQKNDCGGLIIDEYTYQNKIYYNFYIPMPMPKPNDYYDYYGNIVCSDPYQVGYPSCSYFSSDSLIFIRRIWEEK